MRARYPDTEGFVERDGVKVGYEVFGEGEPALVFAPHVRAIVHSRLWKAQVPYLARTIPGHHRRPARQRPVRPADGRRGLRRHEYVADTIAVMDATGDRPGRAHRPVAGAAWRAVLRRPGIPSGSPGWSRSALAPFLCRRCRACRL